MLWQDWVLPDQRIPMSSTPPRSRKKAATKKVVAEKPSTATAADSARMEHQRSVMMRLRRVEGQIRGVLRMIESGSSCEEVAQQLAAARNALDRAFFEMMACSLECEIVDTTGSNEMHERVSEILRLMSKYA